MLDFAKLLTVRYMEGADELPPGAEDALRAQAPKRVAMHFKPVKTATWDHRKLGGGY